MTTMRTLLTTVAALGATLALATGTAAAKVHYEWNGAQAEADGSWVWVWAPAGSDATLKYTFEGQDWKGYQYLFAHESGDSALAHSGRTKQALLHEALPRLAADLLDDDREHREGRVRVVVLPSGGCDEGAFEDRDDRGVP